MGKPFAILIDSRSRFETGEPGGTWLSMPTTAEQLHAAMVRVGVHSDNLQDVFVGNFANTEEYPFDVSLSVIQSSTMDELNYLGRLLQMQSDEERKTFLTAAMLGQHTGSVKDLINLTQNLDSYRIYPAIHSEADYGHYRIDELKELDLPEEAKQYFKYEEYGRDAVRNEQGQFIEQGYVCGSRRPFVERYSGQETDIPQEYRIMRFSKHPMPETIEQEKSVPGQNEPPLKTQPSLQPRPVHPILLTAGKPDEKLKEITDRLEQGITELFHSERYKEYLQVMSKFHNYSFNNTVLIAMQKPDASRIAGFQAWKHNFGRTVRKGEKGIRIIAPSPHKTHQETEKVDPLTGETVFDEDGNPVMETKEIQIPAYKVVSVFDISQTEGRELPAIAANELVGDVKQYGAFFTALERTSYTVCQHYGLDTSDYSFGYIAGWSSGRELAELKHSLAIIRSTAAETPLMSILRKAEKNGKRSRNGPQTSPQSPLLPSCGVKAASCRRIT